jgi:hypothetical protein
MAWARPFGVGSGGGSGATVCFIFTHRPELIGRPKSSKDKIRRQKTRASGCLRTAGHHYAYSLFLPRGKDTPTYRIDFGLRSDSRKRKR